MLRRLIPGICVPVLAVLGIALFADVSAAGPLQRLRDRLGSRNGSSDVIYVSEAQQVSQQPQQIQQQYATQGQPQQLQVVEYQQMSSGRRLLGRRRGGDVVPVTYTTSQQPMVQRATYTTQVPSSSQPLMTSAQPQQEWVMSGSGRRGLLGRRRGGEMVLVSTQPQSSQPQTIGYRAYYRVPTPDAPAGTVLLNVRVPQAAQIWIEGDKTQQTGQLRSFVSPPLEQGKHYTYQVKAEWTENGQKIVRNRKIMVHAGEAVDIDLLRPTQQELRDLQQPLQKQQSEDR